MNKTALVTGSTSGIGEAFANIFSDNGYNLVLVARDAEKLKEQAKRLSQKNHIETYTVVCDLEQPGAADTVFQQVQEYGLQINILINNAGFNEYGNFLSTDRKSVV